MVHFKTDRANDKIRLIMIFAAAFNLAIVAPPLPAQENAPMQLSLAAENIPISARLLGLQNYQISVGTKNPEVGPFQASNLPRIVNAHEVLLETYKTTFGPEDYFNSSGVRLSSLASIVAQDRANFYRFGVRHGSDSPDLIFSNREARALIGNTPVTICCALEEYILDGYDRRYAPVVSVSVFGIGQQISRIFLEVIGLPDVSIYSSN